MKPIDSPLTSQNRRNPFHSIVRHPGFPFLSLVASLAAWGLWYQDPSQGWVLALALAPLALRALAGRLPVSRTPLDLPMAIFLLTAGLGVWAAYDRAGALAIFTKPTPAGWRALWGLMLSILVFYALAAMKTASQQRWALALLAGFGAALAAWFTLTNNWTTNPAQWVPITRLGQVVQSRLPALAGHRLNANITGGIVAVLLPTSLGLLTEVFSPHRRQRWPWVAWGLATGVGMSFGLFLTTSRGAWAALAGGLALDGAWWFAGRLACSRRRIVTFFELLVLGALVGAGIILLFPSLRARLQGSQSLANRLSLYAQAGLLLRDAPFTGVGLGEFPLVHSSYALLIHVPILPHAHSLFLDIALGQGLGGLLAAVAVLGGAAWLGLAALARAGASRPALAAGLLSLAVMVLHGLGDDPLYGSRGVAFFWVPAGLAVAGWRSVAGDAPPARWPAARTWRAAGVAAVAGLVLIALFWRPLAAAWYADLGAVHQMRTELGAYDPHHFNDPTLEQIRAQADLSTAEAYFERALALEPGCATARTRLALIALGRGQDAKALAHARAAWEAGHRDRVTRLVLGDALVAAGEIEAAVETVRGLEWAEARLEGQAWSRYWVSGDYRRAAGAWQAVVLLNPWNARAADAMAAAEERAQNQ